MYIFHYWKHILQIYIETPEKSRQEPTIPRNKIDTSQNKHYEHDPTAQLFMFATPSSHQQNRSVPPAGRRKNRTRDKDATNHIAANQVRDVAGACSPKPAVATLQPRRVGTVFRVFSRATSRSKNGRTRNATSATRIFT